MKKLHILLTLPLFFFFNIGLHSAMAQKVTVLTPKEFHAAMVNGKKIQLVDVRTSDEFAEGHLENAQNINFLETDFITEVEKLDMEKPIYIYCRSGNRSAKAALVLKDVGFREIYDLQGGYLHWESDVLHKTE